MCQKATGGLWVTATGFLNLVITHQLFFVVYYRHTKMGETSKARQVILKRLIEKLGDTKLATLVEYVLFVDSGSNMETYLEKETFQKRVLQAIRYVNSPVTVFELEQCEKGTCSCGQEKEKSHSHNLRALNHVKGCSDDLCPHYMCKRYKQSMVLESQLL